MVVCDMIWKLEMTTVKYRKKVIVFSAVGCRTMIFEWVITGKLLVLNVGLVT